MPKGEFPLLPRFIIFEMYIIHSMLSSHGPPPCCLMSQPPAVTWTPHPLKRTSNIWETCSLLPHFQSSVKSKQLSGTVCIHTSHLEMTCHQGWCDDPIPIQDKKKIFKSASHSGQRKGGRDLKERTQFSPLLLVLFFFSDKVEALLTTIYSHNQGRLQVNNVANRGWLFLLTVFGPYIIPHLRNLRWLAFGGGIEKKTRKFNMKFCYQSTTSKANMYCMQIT